MIGGSAAPILFVAAGTVTSAASNPPTMAQLGARAQDMCIAVGNGPKINGKAFDTLTSVYGYLRVLTQADLAYAIDTNAQVSFAVYRNLPKLAFIGSGTGNTNANAPKIVKAASHKGLIVTGNYGSNSGNGSNVITSPAGFALRAALSPYFISDRLTPPNTPYVDNTPIRTGTAQTALYLFEARQS